MSAFPILNVYEKTANIPKELIEEVRQKFLERVNKNPELYYPQDVDRVKNNDWTVRRFLHSFKSEPNADKAVECLDRAMKWRKSYGVLDIKDTEFAKEAYLCAGVIIYGKDLNGSQVLIMRGKVAKKSKTWREHMQRFLINCIEKIDRDNQGKGMTLLADCRDTGVKNVDIDTLKFMQLALEQYYPGLVNATLVYRMQPVLEAVYKMFRSWLNEEQNKYMYLLDKKNLNDFVSTDQLPDVLMGTNSQPYRTVPSGAPTLHDVADRLNIKKEKADKLAKHCEKFYDN